LVGQLQSPRKLHVFSKQKGNASERDVPTEELFASTTLLNNLNESRLQLLDGRNVVCEHTHFAGFRREIDLDNIL
jgi:hypothetical protein